MRDAASCETGCHSGGRSCRQAEVETVGIARDLLGSFDRLMGDSSIATIRCASAPRAAESPMSASMLASSNLIGFVLASPATTALLKIPKRSTSRS